MERLRNVLLVVACAGIIAQSAVTTGLAGATTAFAAENMKPLLTTIVNTDENPVPVVGTVEATIPSLPVDASGNLKVASQGTANVSVTNLPTDGSGNVKVAGQGTADVSVTNLPTDGSGNLKVAGQGTLDVNVTNASIASEPGLATKFETYTFYTDNGDDETWNFGTRLNASSVTATFSDDKAVLYFFAGSSGSGTRLTFGSIADGLTGVYSVPLLQRVPLDGVKLSCYNLIEDCEVKVTVIGD